jgi:hypothetical protein
MNDKLGVKDIAAVAIAALVLLLGAYLTPTELWLKVIVGLVVGVVAFFGLQLVLHPKSMQELLDDQAKLERQNALKAIKAAAQQIAMIANRINKITIRTKLLEISSAINRITDKYNKNSSIGIDEVSRLGRLASLFLTALTRYEQMTTGEIRMPSDRKSQELTQMEAQDIPRLAQALDELETTLDSANVREMQVAQQTLSDLIELYGLASEKKETMQ